MQFAWGSYTSAWQAHIEQWIDFASLEIDANIMRWIVPRLGFSVYLPPVRIFVQLAFFSYLEYSYIVYRVQK